MSIINGQTGTAADFITASLGAPSAAKGVVTDANGLIDKSFLPFKFGDGSDGACVLDGSTTFPWAGLSGSTYTLTRDIYPSALTINSGITMKTDGFMYFVNGTMDGSGTIDYGTSNNGTSAVTNTAGIGGSSSGSGRFKTQAGGDGGTPVHSTNPGQPGNAGISGQIGSASNGGGPGGASSTPLSGGNGTSSPLSTIFAKLGVGAFNTIYGLDINLSAAFAHYKGSSGGGGGATGATASASNFGGAGGGGGASGGTIWGVVKNWAGSFIIKAVGGNGGNGGNGPGGSPASGGGGGGEGGTGGASVMIFGTKTWTGSYNLVGGTGGTGGTATGAVAGTNGGTGNTGVHYEIDIASLTR